MVLVDQFSWFNTTHQLLQFDGCHKLFSFIQTFHYKFHPLTTVQELLGPMFLWM